MTNLANKVPAYKMTDIYSRDFFVKLCCEQHNQMAFFDRTWRPAGPPPVPDRGGLGDKVRNGVNSITAHCPQRRK